LALDRQFFWLRQDTHKPLAAALSAIAEEKLYHPAQQAVGDKQMRLFAR
jgi:hypothetical protein